MTTTRMLRCLSLSVLLSGCAFTHAVPYGPYGTSHGALQSQSSSHPQCKPSQYWDGEMCRHKGQGQGARKHDG